MKWLDYGVLETILLYRLGWDLCILAVIGRWVLCSGGCPFQHFRQQYSWLEALVVILVSSPIEYSRPSFGLLCSFTATCDV